MRWSCKVTILIAVTQKTICHRVAKIYIFGRVFGLDFRKHQNHFHRTFLGGFGLADTLAQIWNTALLTLNYRVSQKFARIRGTVHCCFVVKFCFSRVSDKTGHKWSKDIFIQIYN